MEIAAIREILKRTDVSFLEKAEFASTANGIGREDEKLKPDFVNSIQWDSLTQDELKHLFTLNFGYEKFPQEVVSRIHWNKMTIYDIVRLLVSKSKNGRDFSWQQEMVVETIIDFSKYSQKTLLWMMRKIKKETWGAHVWKTWLKVISTGKFSKEEILAILPEHSGISYEFIVGKTCRILFARKDVDKAYVLNVLKQGVRLSMYSHDTYSGTSNHNEKSPKVQKAIAEAVMQSGLLSDEEIFSIGKRYSAHWMIVKVLSEKLTVNQLAEIVGGFDLVPESSQVPPDEWTLFLKKLEQFKKIETSEQKDDLIKIGRKVNHYILWSIIFYSYLRPNSIIPEKADIAAMLSETKDARVYALLVKGDYITLDVKLVNEFHKFVEATKPEKRDAYRVDSSGIYKFWEHASKKLDWPTIHKKQAVALCKKINNHMMWKQMVTRFGFSFSELHELIKAGAPESLLAVTS